MGTVAEPATASSAASAIHPRLYRHPSQQTIRTLLRRYSSRPAEHLLVEEGAAAEAAAEAAAGITGALPQAQGERLPLPLPLYRAVPSAAAAKGTAESGGPTR